MFFFFDPIYFFAGLFLSKVITNSFASIYYINCSFLSMCLAQKNFVFINPPPLTFRM